MAKNICATASGCRGVKKVLESSRDIIDQSVQALERELGQVQNNFKDDRVKKVEDLVSMVRTNMKNVRPDIEQVCAKLEKYAQFLES